MRGWHRGHKCLGSRHMPMQMGTQRGDGRQSFNNFTQIELFCLTANSTLWRESRISIHRMGQQISMGTLQSRKILETGGLAPISLPMSVVKDWHTMV
ncbi:hypothetical protein J5N97_015081 [Dioscorea zingiberensis]|uniref:Uncharacterized protein n=1 Tax=Dioscorea zingiberensis TaxID=325984 RepID=A0A9D5HKN8_9LILI|nr:hypothetical protein J5N97_015081 [Dioscorea zingiberensis]